LHFVSGKEKSSRVCYDRMRGEFKAICIPPCANTIYFQSGMLMPYMIPDEALQRGYVDVDDYRLVGKSEKNSQSK
jgi:hypothetical protein